MDLNKYKDWAGSRDKLVEILNHLEKQNPKRFALFAKNSGKLLPLKKTRIQRLIELGVLPKAQYQKEASTKTAEYGIHHILHYLSAITARKAGFTFDQISTMMNDYAEEDLLRIIQTEDFPDKNNNLLNTPSTVLSAKRKSEILQSLDRKEGRPLLSEQTLIAVTPWLHLYISKSKLSRVGSEEIDVICQAIKDSLTQVTGSE
jgi:hypothetical protein